MAKPNSRSKPLTAFRLALLATSLLATAPAMAQLTTATIRGTVSSGEAAAAGATVTATNVETGDSRTATTGADGGYNLTGLRPGTYDISFTPGGGEAVVRRVIVSVGQTASLDADTSANSTSIDDQGATAPGSAAAGENTIVVTGTRLVEVKTSEVATNVSREQIENLPQNNRNFLNFAALAAGHSSQPDGISPEFRRRRRRCRPQRRYVRGAADQRLHRRRQPQIQRQPGRHRRPGRQPR